MRRALLCLILALVFPGGAVAQAIAPPPPEDTVAQALDEKLQRLLELLGSVQFLRQLCDPSETTRWRERAALLIDAEAPDEGRREELTAAFNRGYRAFGTYTDCTDNALFALDRFTEEGERLTRDILVRYGD